MRTGSKQIVVNLEFSDNPVEQSAKARQATVDVGMTSLMGIHGGRVAKTIQEHQQAEKYHTHWANDLAAKGYPYWGGLHRTAAAHHATAAHVLERHGYNSSDDVEAGREF